MFKELQIHSKGINDVVFVENKNMIVTASADGTCKIFELTTMKILKSLSFKPSINDKNCLMRRVKYDNYSNMLFTIEGNLRGNTYLTKWDVSNNFEPVDTIVVSGVACTSMDYSPRHQLVGIADCEGSVIYVDGNNLAINKKLRISDITVKSVSFIGNNLVAGTADNSLSLNYLYKGNMITLGFLFKICLLIFIGIYLHKRINESGINY